MEITKERLSDLYVKQGLNQTEIAKILFCNQANVSYFCRKYGLVKEKRDKKIKSKDQRHWSKEDEEKLADLLGLFSYTTIAKILGRTPKAVNEKRKRLQLGETKNATEYINSNELAEALGRMPCTIRSWAKNNGLPHSKKVLAHERRYYRISVKEFWKWAKNHKSFMRWDLYELGNLPNEPKWILEEKKKPVDKLLKRKWTKTDETLLLFYYNQKLTLQEIGEKLNRSKKAIDQKLVKLGIRRRTIQIEWKKEEVEILINMRKQGRTYNDIAEELGRSLDGVKSKYNYIEDRKAITY